ncbi:hypothetical protein FB107DRAFT_267591, partial [Schizophyllum commune]
MTTSLPNSPSPGFNPSAGQTPASPAVPFPSSNFDPDPASPPLSPQAHPTPTIAPVRSPTTESPDSQPNTSPLTYSDKLSALPVPSPANSPNPNRGIKSPVFSTRGFRRSLDASFSLPSFGSSSMSDNLHHTSPVMYPNSPSLGRWTLGGRPRGASASEGSLASQTAPPRRTSTDGERASLPTVHSLRQGAWGAEQL